MMSILALEDTTISCIRLNSHLLPTAVASIFLRNLGEGCPLEQRFLYKGDIQDILVKVNDD